MVRGSTLWGERGGRARILALAVAATALALLAPGVASSAPKGAAIPQRLLDAVQANPEGTFPVIIQAASGEQSEKFASRLSRELAKDQGLKTDQSPNFGGRLRASFASINGFAVELTGKQILKLATKSGVLAIAPDSSVTMAGNPQRWPAAVGADWFLRSSFSRGGRAATIAIVDSGIDKGSSSMRSRVIKHVDMGGGTGDSRGHGTFVAGVAAGNGAFEGVAPDAKLVSLDVFDAEGRGKTSDVIRAADWILKNKDAYRIRVANFSLQSGQPGSFLYDPLNRAVERLWHAGVVVVAAAGNYADGGQPSGVLFAPGNDPFVITVGAVDVNGTSGTADDTNAPWSAYGYTPDGFAKPEIAAPGRYMIEQVPLGSTLLRDFSRNVFNAPTGLLQLSGTSFSAAVVSGMAANLLRVHPEWTPDQVKGELMVSAVPLPSAMPMSVGVGEVNLRHALASPLAFASPPNPNAALEQFLVSDPAGGPLPVFDAQRWIQVASSDASWNSASWSSASWNSASWSSASWSSASWNNNADLDGRGEG